MLLARRLLVVLTALVVLVSAFGRVSTAWACEGRVCSSDVARCCCASGEQARDGSCLSASNDQAGACKGQCACTAVVVKATVSGMIQPPKAVHTMPLVEVMPPAVPSHVPHLQAYVALETPQVRAIPPPHRLPDPPCVEHACLRAPPATA